MKRVLITGGTGFVGSNLTRRLLADGHEVGLLLRDDCATWRITSVRPDVRLLWADLLDAEAVRRALKEASPDWIFHLAAYGAYPFQKDLDRIVRTNVNGVSNLVQAALASGFEALVNTGSSSEYGYTDAAPGEGTALEPNSAYSWSKGSATQFCRYLARDHSVQIPTLRLYSVYGPFEEPSRFLPTLITRGRRGELPPLADPRVARDYVYVDDVCEAFVRAATQPSEDPGAVYNVGTGVQSTLADVVAVARRRLGIDAEPVWGSMANRSWDTTVWVSDPTRIARGLGWRAMYSLADGFAAFADWFAAHPELVAHYEGQLAAGAAVRA